MAGRDTFDARRLRFPAVWERGATLRVSLLARRAAPYSVAAAVPWPDFSSDGCFVVYVGRRGVHGLEAVAAGRDRAEASRRMRRLLAAPGVARFVDGAYQAVGRDNDRVRTRRSSVAGRGVFARRDVVKGAVIEDVSRPLVRYARVPKKGQPGYGHAIQIERGWWLLLGHSPLYFLNHSCEPNTRLRIRGATVEVVASRAIAAGEELFLDYATVAFRDDPYSFSCTCGARGCRGVVKGRR